MRSQHRSPNSNTCGRGMLAATLCWVTESTETIERLAVESLEMREEMRVMLEWVLGAIGVSVGLGVLRPTVCRYILRRGRGSIENGGLLGRGRLRTTPEPRRVEWKVPGAIRIIIRTPSKLVDPETGMATI